MTPTTRSTFLLDMDGVLVDFIRPALAAHDRLDVLDDWPAGTWDISAILGISIDAFWEPVHAAGAEFWSELDAYDWADELVELLRAHGRFFILSSPSPHASCAAGKIAWLQARFGRDFRDFLIGPRKWLCARPGSILVDDSDTNVDRFALYGGQAILFPQPWNRNHALTDDRMGYVADELGKLS